MIPFWRLPPVLVREQFSRSARPREPEPMLMEDADAVADFDEAGASAPALIAIYDMSARSVNALLPEGGRLLDLGSGSGNFLEQFARRRPDATVIGVDLSAPMLHTARDRLGRAGVADRVTVHTADVTDIPEEVLADGVDVVSCLNLLHQLPDVATLDRALAEVVRLRERFGCGVFLMDLVRLKRADSFPTTLSVFGAGMPEIARRDALASEAAAFTIEELQDRLQDVGMEDMRLGYAVPLRVWQIHWAPVADGRPAGTERWTDVPLDPAAARLAKVQRFRGLPT